MPRADGTDRTGAGPGEVPGRRKPGIADAIRLRAPRMPNRTWAAVGVLQDHYIRLDLTQGSFFCPLTLSRDSPALERKSIDPATKRRSPKSPPRPRRTAKHWSRHSN